jgi:DNA-binding transcriptional LysR family regulator
MNGAMIFVNVVKAGSFTKAALNLKMPTSTVSDKVGALEAELGTTLLVRTTRKLKLTEAGSRYFEKVEGALSLLANANEEVKSLQNNPSGVVRITGPSEFSPQSLAEIILEYRKKFPNVKLEAQMTNRIVDLIGEGFDLAIRGGELKDSSLKVKSIGKNRFIFIASESYLKSSPKINHPKDISNHSCIGFLGNTAEVEVPWNVEGEGRKFKCKPNFIVSTNSFSATVELVKAGAGVSLVPQTYVASELAKKTVVQILPQWGTRISAVHLVYPDQKFDSPKVRELLSIVERRLRKNLDIDQW